MKRCIIILLICIMSANACGSKDAPVSKVQVKFEQVKKQELFETGVKMLTVSENYPVVTIKGNDSATKKINSFYNKKREEFHKKVAGYLKSAKEDYLLKTGEDLKTWIGYELMTDYSLARADDKVISIIENDLEYAGGMHPSSNRTAQNFDSETGGLLTLQDVTTDEKAANAFLEEYLLKLMKDPKYEGILFPDYQKYVKEILTDNTWYLNDQGFVVIANNYIIAPYAAGIMEFTIPYKDFGYLKEKYRKS